MAFNGKEGAPIDLEEAASWTSNYRNAQPNGIKAHFFGRDIIERILAQEDCQGLRIFYGLNNEGEQQLILVGADTNENNQLSGTIADHSVVCPVACGNADALNS